ncbi:MAG: ribbon-helix-helix domain-containing protein [Pseudonocardiaceae bacterium]
MPGPDTPPVESRCPKDNRILAPITTGQFAGQHQCPRCRRKFKDLTGLTQKSREIAGRSTIGSIIQVRVPKPMVAQVKNLARARGDSNSAIYREALVIGLAILEGNPIRNQGKTG